MGIFVWDPSLGTFAWKLSLGSFRPGSMVFGNFRSGAIAWGAGLMGLGELGTSGGGNRWADPGGTLGAVFVCLVIKTTSEDPSK